MENVLKHERESLIDRKYNGRKSKATTAAYFVLLILPCFQIFKKKNKKVGSTLIIMNYL
jgi:hypothetical protein